MKANPGGQIDLKEIIGRNQIIDQIWDTLEQQSIRINAERRIGKTTIIKKLNAEPRKGWIPIFQDLEKCHTALEFAYEVYREAEKHLSKSNQLANKARELLQSFGGTEVGGVIKLPSFSDERPWKEILSKSIQDLLYECEKNNQNLLFLWDEVPYMLSNIKDKEGEKAAMEVFDTLRSLRQSHADSGLRMILTGSIGIHHVITSLKQQSYANSPLNDTYAIAVPPLDVDSAIDLAIKLIEGEKIQTKNLQESARAIAHTADHFPFYIHHIVKALKLSGLDGTSASIEKIVHKQIMDANDPWELSHYRDRIPVYYGKENESTVVGILDSIAVSDEASSVNDLLSDLKNAGLLNNRETLLQLLRLIEQDHYLARNSEGHYQFQFPLIKRWWKGFRGL